MKPSSLSDWQSGPSADDLREAINEGMPPWQYTLIHPGARLLDAETNTLVSGYAASLSANEGSSPAP